MKQKFKFRTSFPLFSSGLSSNLTSSGNNIWTSYNHLGKQGKNPKSSTSLSTRGQCMCRKFTHINQDLVDLLSYCFPGNGENHFSPTSEFFPLYSFLHASVRCSKTNEEVEKQISIHTLKQSFKKGNGYWNELSFYFCLLI